MNAFVATLWCGNQEERLHMQWEESNIEYPCTSEGYETTSFIQTNINSSAITTAIGNSFLFPSQKSIMYFIQR